MNTRPKHRDIRDYLSNDRHGEGARRAVIHRDNSITVLVTLHGGRKMPLDYGSTRDYALDDGQVVPARRVPG